jgi:beta-glucosidase
MKNRTYKYYKGDVLYPFGYGLSYAEVQYKNTNYKLNPISGNLELNTKITNLSDFESTEVVQVYLNMPDAPIETPQQQLVSFSRIKLMPNSTKTVEQIIPKEKLTYINKQGKTLKYQGKLIVTVAAGQGIKTSENKYIKTEVTLP